MRPARLAGTVTVALACAVLLPFPAQRSAVARESAAVAPDVQQAVAALRAISTMRADFTQTTDLGQRSTGVLTLKRPGHIRFQYAPGIPMVIVSDGRALSVIDTELHQVQRWPIGNSPLGALLDPARDVTRYGALQPSFDARIVSIAVRDTTHPEFGTIDLLFERKPAAPGGLELVGWQTHDAQGRRTNIRLANQRYGVAVDDALFRYIDPHARPH